MNKEDDIFRIFRIGEVPFHLLTKSNIDFLFIRPENNFCYHVLKSLRVDIYFTVDVGSKVHIQDSMRRV